MEGLRLLPHYQAAAAERLVPRSCADCQRTTTMTTRQHMGCGYEAPLPVALGKPRPWVPRYWAMRGWEAGTCPGYTCALPEVVEVTHALPQWEAGTLTEWLGGAPPSRALLDALAQYKAGASERIAAMGEK